MIMYIFKFSITVICKIYSICRNSSIYIFFFNSIIFTTYFLTALENTKFSRASEGMLLVTPIKITLFCTCDTISFPDLLLLAIALNSLSSLLILINEPASTLEPDDIVCKSVNPVSVRFLT